MKCLPDEHAGRGLIGESPHQNVSTVVHSSNPSSVEVDLGGSLGFADQPDQLNQQLQIQGEALSQNIKWSVMEKYSRL